LSPSTKTPCVTSAGTDVGTVYRKYCVYGSGSGAARIRIFLSYGTPPEHKQTIFKKGKFLFFRPLSESENRSYLKVCR
jgi:hypothetical protein